MAIGCWHRRLTGEMSMDCPGLHGLMRVTFLETQTSPSEKKGSIWSFSESMLGSHAWSAGYSPTCCRSFRKGAPPLTLLEGVHLSRPISAGQRSIRLTAPSESTQATAAASDRNTLGQLPLDVGYCLFGKWLSCLASFDGLGASSVCSYASAFTKPL